MLNFEFSLPTKIVFGKDAQKKIPEIIINNGFKKILLHSYQENVCKNIKIFFEVKQILNDAKINFIELLGVQPNPTLELIGIGIEVSRREKVDCILAVGGGSVIDSAKGIALGINTSLEDVWAFASGTKTPDPQKTIKVGCVLTAAGAGSETSTAAVISNPKTGEKVGAHHDANRPYFAILNPEITYSVPPFQTACGVFDSIMHACERYFTASQDTPISDRITEGIVKSIVEAGYKVMLNPSDYETRATLMWGASMAHNNIGGCGRLKGSGVHYIEEQLHSVNRKIIHGAGLSVVFPSWARQIYKRCVPRFVQFAVRVWGIEMNYENPEGTALKGIEKMESFIDYLKLPKTLRDIGIYKKSFPDVVERCVGNGRKVSQLCEINAQDILEILERAE